MIDLLLERKLRADPLRIVDIGASGRFHPRWRKTTAEIQAILFEPDPRAYDRLESKASHHYVPLNSALSDRAGHADFHLCRKQDVSSLYLPNLELLQRFPDVEKFEVVNTIKIFTDTLDNQLRRAGIDSVDFLKIDVQGHELPILRGAIKTLRAVIGLELEVEFVELYKGQPLFPELQSSLTQMGFELFDLKREFWKRRDARNYGNHVKGQLIYGDALYFRTPESVCANLCTGETKALHAVLVYMAYGYLDLAEVLVRLAEERRALSPEMSQRILSFLERQRRKKTMPDFRGKGRVHNILSHFAEVFRRGDWYNGDTTLGNA
jgi:FkbM family methyltransferase